MKRDLEMVDRNSGVDLPVLMDEPGGCMTRDAKGAAARALALLILGAVAALGCFALYAGWLVNR